MSLNDYVKAQKLGEKRYQAALSKNEYPYLPVLDELIVPSFFRSLYIYNKNRKLPVVNRIFIFFTP